MINEALKLVLNILILFIVGYIVMLLWNWLMPVIFGLVKVNFWQSTGLLMLSNLLFKSHKNYDN